jgi:hypothetical protein
MQHWFDNLEVTDAGFSVTLNFGDAPEPLYIPFDAIKTFVDPSVEFGLRFESPDDDDTPLAPINTDHVDGPESAKKPDADIVSLDNFRK